MYPGNILDQGRGNDALFSQRYGAREHDWEVLRECWVTSI